MNNETLEHLSALMDGELSTETGLFVSRRMGSDAELGQTWQRYHLIRECLRRPGQPRATGCIDVDLASLSPEPRTSPMAAARWLRPLSGVAIAASVALVAVLLVAGGDRGAVTEGEPVPFASPNPLTALPISQPASLNGQDAGRQRLNNYLLRHNQAAGRVGRQGIIALVPIVATAPVAAESGERFERAGEAVEDEPGSNPGDAGEVQGSD